MRRHIPVFAALLLLCIGILSSLHARRPEIEVRFVRRHGLTGNLNPAAPISQGFRCEDAGLHRIDVAILSLIPHPIDELVLVLREGHPNGLEVRRAVADPDETHTPDDYLEFAFEPLADSAGREYWFTITSTRRELPSDYALWWRWRGQLVLDRPWGSEVLEGNTFEGAFRAAYRDLAGLLVPVESLDPSTEPAWNEIWETRGETLLRCEQHPRAPITRGHACFPFAARPDSRHRDFRFRLHLPPGARVIGTAEGLSFHSLYGAGWQPERLCGMSVAGVIAVEQDLVFRAWTRGGPQRELARLRSRGGLRVLVGLAVWLAAMIVLASVWTRRSQPVAP